jgi:hypothetical protein
MGACGCRLCRRDASGAVVGGALDVSPLVWWGIVSAYLGISWIVPGACAGAAAAQWGKDRGVRRPNAAGFTVGTIVTVSLLILLAGIVAAFLGDSTREAVRRPAIGSQSERTSLVTQSLPGRRTGFGPAIWVMCERSGALCAVTYDVPACQLWIVENVNGVDKARPFSEPSEGAQGTYNEQYGSVSCLGETP